MTLRTTIPVNTCEFMHHSLHEYILLIVRCFRLVGWFFFSQLKWPTSCQSGESLWLVVGTVISPLLTIPPTHLPTTYRVYPLSNASQLQYLELLTYRSTYLPKNTQGLLLRGREHSLELPFTYLDVSAESASETAWMNRVPPSMQ